MKKQEMIDSFEKAIKNDKIKFYRYNNKNFDTCDEVECVNSKILGLKKDKITITLIEHVSGENHNMRIELKHNRIFLYGIYVLNCYEIDYPLYKDQFNKLSKLVNNRIDPIYTAAEKKRKKNINKKQKYIKKILFKTLNK